MNQKIKIKVVADEYVMLSKMGSQIDNKRKKVIHDKDIA
jgi:hypothetical protein